MIHRKQRMIFNNISNACRSRAMYSVSIPSTMLVCPSCIQSPLKLRKGNTACVQTTQSCSLRIDSHSPRSLSSFAVPDSPTAEKSKSLSESGSSDKIPTPAASNGEDKSDSKSSNLFLDYMGTIFLTGIGLVVATLVRSYQGSNNRNRMRENVEESSAIDPLEIDDLRISNPEFTLAVYRAILSDLQQNDSGVITYADFVASARTTMRRLKGDAFTIELGHLLDRVVVGYLTMHNQTSNDPQPILLWMTLLNLAMNAPVPDRILALYESARNTTDTTNGKVTMAKARELIDYLQDTCQLTPDVQVVEVEDQKYPFQQYTRGSVQKELEWDGTDRDELNIDAFASLLKSRAVCVWGECYHRRKVM